MKILTPIQIFLKEWGFRAPNENGDVFYFCETNNTEAWDFKYVLLNINAQSLFKKTAGN